MLERVQVDAKSASSGSVELEKSSESIGHGRDHGFDLQKIQVNERRVLTKIDLRVVPVLCVLYLLAFLDRYVSRTILRTLALIPRVDRVNIANAALFGLKQDLKLGGTEYNTALVIL